MVYRARCTSIVSLVESLFNINKFNLVKDKNDTYIEVPDEDLAELIEDANRLYRRYLGVKFHIIEWSLKL